MDKDTLYCYIICDSFLIKQSVLLVTLVINQGFFSPLVAVGSITLVYIITNFFHYSSEQMLLYVCQRNAGTFSMMLCNFSENTNGWSMIAFFFLTHLSFERKKNITCSPQREKREKGWKVPTSIYFCVIKTFKSTKEHSFRIIHVVMCLKRH